MNAASSALKWGKGFPPDIWLVSAATFINRSIGFLGLFAAIFFSSIRLSATLVAVALLIVGCAGIAGSIVGGRLATRYEPRAVLIGGSAINIPILFALAWVHHPVGVVLALAAVSVAVSQSFLAPAATLVTESTFKGDTATAFAFYRIFINVGSIVAPVIVGVLGAYKFPLLFLLSGVGSAVTTALLIGGRRLLRPTQIAPGEQETATAAPGQLPGPSPLAIWTVVIVFGLAIAIYAQHQSGIPLSVERLPDGARLYAILLLVNPVIIIGCELPLSYLLARVPWRYSLAIGVAANGVGLAITGLGTTWVVCIAGFVVFSLGEALFAPQANAAIAKLSPPGCNARNQGYLSAAQTAGIAIGPAIGAYAALNARVPFWLAVIALSAAAATAVLVSARTKPSAPANAAAEKGVTADALPPQAEMIREKVQHK